MAPLLVIQAFTDHCAAQRQTTGHWLALELPACKASLVVLRDTSPQVYAEIVLQARGVSYERRPYGGGLCFTWAIVPGLGPMAAHPGRSYPRAKLLYDLYCRRPEVVAYLNTHKGGISNAQI